MALSWAAVSAGVVALYWLKLHYGRKEQLTRGPLTDQTEALHADLQSVYDELSDKIEQVNERLDFTERLLPRPQTVGEASVPEETSSELTPV